MLNNNNNNIYKQGFTLIEVLLVLGVILSLSVYQFKKTHDDYIDFQAKAVSSQLLSISSATNSYINMYYDKIIKLKDINGGDGYPLLCSTTEKRCQITLTTLKNANLIPKSTSEENILKSEYRIDLKIEGSLPYQQVNGLVILTKPVSIPEKSLFLGKVIQNAGIDSGYSINDHQVNGLFGSWTENSLNYKSINKPDLLAYRVGYKSNMYSIYLRRDGTLPMTGNLNLGNNDINDINDLFVNNNAKINKNITAGGNIQSSGFVSAKNYLETFNQSGDILRIGGGTNDYQIKLLNNSKPLNIVRENGNPQNNLLLNISGSVAASGNINIKEKTTTKTLNVSDRAKFDEYLELTKTAIVGSKCSPNGLIGRNSQGFIISCVNGKWLSNSDFTLPVGAPVPWPSNVIPEHWLEANGQSFNKSTYPKLAIVYPSGRLPDLRGEFIRGWDHGKGIDETSNRTLLSSQLDQIQNITGQFPIELDYNGTNVKGAFYFDGTQVRGRNAEPGGKIDELIKFDSSRVVRAGKETRGRNIAFMYIIRAQ